MPEQGAWNESRHHDHDWLVGVLIVSVVAAATWRNTRFDDPPRFDGAGYSVLARAIIEGRGYREVDHPDAPRHAHFPPGYPFALAALWRMTGATSMAAAHGFSLVCTSAATLAAWCWFRTMYGRGVAGLLGLALAVNWTWGRVGGAIQSEPLFLLLGQLALLAAARAGRHNEARAWAGPILGVALAACALTRHVGVTLSAAVGIDLLLRRRRTTAVVTVMTWSALIIPWGIWVATAGVPNQAGLLALDRGKLGVGVAAQAKFYLQRLPDQIVGPFVEVGTVFQRGAVVSIVVNTWAVLATGLLIVGWARTLRTPRRRLAGLAAVCTFALLLVWPFTEAGRFLVPLVPCILVGAVEGLGALAALPRARRAAAWVLLIVSLPYAGYVIINDRAGALRRTHADFDSACAWVARDGLKPGPILTRHPGEAYWQTGRKALSPSAGTPEDVGREVGRWKVAYLLIDGARYADAPDDPLEGFVLQHPEQVREVWPRAGRRSTVRVFEVVPRVQAQRVGPSNRSRP